MRAETVGVGTVDRASNFLVIGLLRQERRAYADLRDALAPLPVAGLRLEEDTILALAERGISEPAATGTWVWPVSSTIFRVWYTA